MTRVTRPKAKKSKPSKDPTNPREIDRLTRTFERFVRVVTSFDPPSLPVSIVYTKLKPAIGAATLERLCASQNMITCWLEIFNQAGLLRISLQNALTWADGCLDDIRSEFGNADRNNISKAKDVNPNTYLYLHRESISTALNLFAFRERIGWLLAIAVENLFEQEELRYSVGMNLSRQEVKSVLSRTARKRLQKVSFASCLKRLSENNPDHQAIDILEKYFVGGEDQKFIDRFRHDVTHNFTPSIDDQKMPFQYVSYKYNSIGEPVSMMTSMRGMSPADWNSIDLIEALSRTWNNFREGTLELCKLPEFVAQD